MSNQSLLKMFVTVLIISIISLFLSETGVGKALNIILFFTYFLGILILAIATFNQIFTITLNIVTGRKDDERTAELVQVNNFILQVCVFFLAFYLSNMIMIFQIGNHTFLGNIKASLKDGSILIDCLDMLPLLFLNKKIREHPGWTFLICGLILFGFCYQLYHSLDSLDGFGAGI